MSNISYIADISGDVDDLVAILYLNEIGKLYSVVLDGKSCDDSRISIIEKAGVKITESVETDIVFCGGAFTKLQKAHLDGKAFKLVVVNGFFAGSLVFNQENCVGKFKGLHKCKSYNPNLDVASANYLIQNIPFVAVSKDVCHHPNNVCGKWHGSHDCKPTKKLHDLLMAKEGLRILENEETMFEYSRVDIINYGLEWGSVLNPNSKISIVSDIRKQWL